MLRCCLAMDFTCVTLPIKTNWSKGQDSQDSPVFSKRNSTFAYILNLYYPFIFNYFLHLSC